MLRQVSCVNNALLIILSACLTGLMAQACQGPAPSARIACGSCEGQDRLVRLQSRLASSDKNSPPFTHPITFGPEDWRLILKSIHVQPQNQLFLLFSTKGPVEPAFTDEEIDYLSPLLSRVFAQARSDEQVVFALSRHPTSDITEITSGAWFVTGQSLHLVLAYYRYAVTVPTVRERIWQDPLRPDSAPSYDLVAGEYQTVEGETVAPRQLIPTTLPAVAISYKELLTGGLPSQSAAGKSRVSDQFSAPESRTAHSNPTIEERLRQLKRLWEQGLITEEEYNAKKKQVLQGL